ncbi:MAG: hypothetical protein ABRQ38_01585 [Candidatus Eremiobacterota bacterium]
MEQDKYTVNEIFKELIPYIPGELVSSEIIDTIKTLNQKLPASLTTAGGFECRLGKNEPSADWQICINLSDYGREVLADNIDKGKLDDSLFYTSEWQHIRKFASYWSDPASPLYNRTNNIWLEFDLERLKEKIPVPGLFFNIRPEITEPSKEDIYGCILDGLTCLGGKSLRKKIRDNLRFCLQTLPEGARMVYAALMMSRDTEAVRVVIDIDKGSLKDYLASIKFPDSTQELMELLEELSQFAGFCRYNLDISYKVLPKIGIEYFLQSKEEKEKPDWERFLAYLVRSSLCTPEKCDALLKWTGYTRTIFPFDLFYSYIFRKISHVKIVCQKDFPPEAKAYISFWRNFETDILTWRKPPVHESL